MLVDGSVQIAPFAADLDIGLINPDRAAVGSSKLPQPFLDHRSISQYPAVDRAMIDLETPFAKHLFQISITQRISQIPGNRLYNQPCLEMPAFEIILRLALQLLGNGIQNHGSLRNFQSGKFDAYGQHTVKQENLRQAPTGHSGLNTRPTGSTSPISRASMARRAA